MIILLINFSFFRIEKKLIYYIVFKIIADFVGVRKLTIKILLLKKFLVDEKMIFKTSDDMTATIRDLFNYYLVKNKDNLKKNKKSKKKLKKE